MSVRQGVRRVSGMLRAGLGDVLSNVECQPKPRDLLTDVFRLATFSGHLLMMQAWYNYCWRPCEMRRKLREC